MRLVRDLALVILVLGGAVGFSQVPRFVQEYEQRLGGALQEAERQVRRIQDLAGAPAEALGRRLAGEADPVVAGVGRAVAEQVARARELGAEAEALAAAGRLRKPLLLLRHHDRELLRATWGRYQPTLTLDLAFAAIGALAGLLANGAAWAMLGRLARRAGRRRLRAPAASD